MIIIIIIINILLLLLLYYYYYYYGYRLLDSKVSNTFFNVQSWLNDP